MTTFPHYLHTVLDTTDPRGLAEFYRELLGLDYRPGDEPPTDGSPDDADWLVLVEPGGRRVLATQLVARAEADHLARARRPDAAPHGLHRRRRSPRSSTTGRGPRPWARGSLLDRTDDPDEPLYVLADPAGHPFCIFPR